MNSTDVCSDGLFGPAATCANTLDFTLVFEQSILSIGPCAFLILVSSFQIPRLWRESRKTLPGRSWLSKAVLATALIGTHLVLLVLWTRNDAIKTAIPYAAVYLTASLVVSIQIISQHTRSLRPSTSISVFLLASIIVDAVQIRTLVLRSFYTEIYGTLATAMILKLFLLCLETRSKRPHLKEPYSKLPEETITGIFNRSLFWWLHSTFKQGFRSSITMESLCDIDISLQSASTQSHIIRNWRKYARKGRFALVTSLASTLKWPLLAAVFPRVCLVGFNYAQPYLIQTALSLLEETPNERTRMYGHGLIGATALVYLGIAITTAMYQSKLCRSLVMVRAATVSLIYNATLENTAGSVNDEAAATTLMSTDVDRTVNSLELLHETWARILEIAIGTWLLTRELGAISIAPILVAIFCFTWQIWLARYMGPRQKPWTQAIQSRVARTSSVLRHMKAIKMMGLTAHIEEMLQAQRVRELKLSKSFRWMIVWINMVASMPQVLAPLVTFVVYAIRVEIRNGDTLSLAKAFASLAIVSLITTPAVQLLASIPALRVAEGCLDRIQKFLLSSEMDTPRTRDSDEDQGIESTQRTSEHEMAEMCPRNPEEVIRLQGISLRPTKDADCLLRDVNLTIFSATHTIILGPVGSGKTTLLKTFLRETRPETGSLRVLTNSTGYCSQTPWLPNGTLRDVICSAVEYDHAWYSTVAHACELQDVIDQFERREKPVIGSRGSSLSGGQQQRLALARAIYARPALLVLDDIFSALDRKTEDKLVQQLFSNDGLLRKLGCTVLLVTSTLRYASIFDRIIVINPMTKALEERTLDQLDECSEFTSTLRSAKEPSITNIESTSEAYSRNPSPKVSSTTKQQDAEDVARRTGDFSVYLYYYRSIGFSRTLITLLILGVFTLCSNLPKYWIQWYIKDPSSRYPLFIGIYTMLALIGSFSQGAMIWQIMINVVPKSGAELHRILLRTIMHAPIDFFSTVDSGVTLNRFSQDMTLVDAVLPTVAFGTFLALLQCTAQLIYIALGSSYMGLCIPVLLVTVYVLQRVYLRTSRQLRLLDLEAKSPLFSQFSETIEGLVTIRAFAWQDHFVQKNVKWLDQSQKPFYLLLCAQRWLTLVLDLLAASVATLVVALAIYLRSTTSGASLGLALTAVLSLSQALQGLMLSWTQMETSLGAIARTKSLESALLPEDERDDVQEPPSDWPHDGSIEFRNVSASYGESHVALSNISFHVKPKQKIGIIGRSGSGKSTLLSVLLRLVDMSQAVEPHVPDEFGQIFIDDLSIATIPRERVRSRILSIPQDALLLAGSTVRSNASPFQLQLEGEVSIIYDELIISSLRKVGLWELFSARGGLDMPMNSDSLSEGQMQLFAIARTIATKELARLSTNGVAAMHYKILLLDEATSHLDNKTDMQIQAVIRDEFSDFTVVTVAHRLESVQDSDIIGVIENGQLVHFGPPAAVLWNKNVPQ